ncbi:hypothetical protein AAC387_Pa08g0262 [Persea americana]
MRVELPESRRNSRILERQQQHNGWKVGEQNHKYSPRCQPPSLPPSLPFQVPSSNHQDRNKSESTLF